jgi:hypothetical protein
MTIMIDHYMDRIQNLGEAAKDEEAAITDVQEESKVKLVDAEKSKATMNKFYSDITRFWTLETECIVGHILYAPPIAVGSGNKWFIEDWALIELDCTKFNWNTFLGNVINIGMFRSILLRSSS